MTGGSHGESASGNAVAAAVRSPSHTAGRPGASRVAARTWWLTAATPGTFMIRWAGQPTAWPRPGRGTSRRVSLLDECFAANRRWAAATSARDPGFFERLESLQNPDLLWIGCSDSRLP